MSSRIVLPILTDTEAANRILEAGELYFNSSQNQLFVTRNNGTDSTTEGGGGGTVTDYIYEVNLGAYPRIGGFVDVTVSGFIQDYPCTIEQVAYPISSKGASYDENEMDSIVCTGYATSTTNVRMYWHSKTFVKGNFHFYIKQLNIPV